jgi:multicomponent Na+:H+ antiporter subunit C
MTPALDAATLLGMAGAGLVGIGLFVIIVHPRVLRKIIGFNLLGAGIFLVFGVAAKRGAVIRIGSDPVPQALVITGIVVAFAATALAVTLLRRHFELTGLSSLPSPAPDDSARGDR